jgi:hypothetical protein
MTRTQRCVNWVPVDDELDDILQVNVAPHDLAVVVYVVANILSYMVAIAAIMILGDGLYCVFSVARSISNTVLFIP